jgi:hypothetical protein
MPQVFFSIPIDFCYPEMITDVTTKIATPLSRDSKLSDAHLESLKRREGEGGMPLRPED